MYLCSQATNETQLGRLKAEAVLEYQQQWYSKVERSQRLNDMTDFLVDPRR